MKQVKLSDIAELNINIPFFFFSSAKYRHHFVRKDESGYLIDSGHYNGLRYTQDSDVYISDANFRKYFIEAAE